MKRIVKEYFTFSKKERIAVLILVVLMSGFIAAPYLYKPKAAMPVLKKELASLLSAGNAVVTGNDGDRPVNLPVTTAKHVAEVFPFDPNTITDTDWVRLGISAKTTRTILNYRNKGGKFRLPEDIRKIWGIRKEDAERLIPYVQIAGTRARETEAGKQVPGAVIKQAVPIDINTAAVEQWRLLPGIGDAIAGRVVKFRDKIGGFLSVEQVKKTYGISDSVFAAILPYLRFDPASLPKLSLNTASAYDLRLRTGMPYAMAKSIVGYREENGSYTSLSDIKKAFPIPDSVFQKLLLLIKNE